MEVTEPTQCRANRETLLGDRDELVCPKLAVVTPGNRLPIEETSDGCCSPSCIVHKDAWTPQKQKGHHIPEANTQALQKVFGVAFRTEEDDAMVSFGSSCKRSLQKGTPLGRTQGNPL
ncbi:hypothetical protein EMCRGX_G018314 [Ephydatia muelleri]